MLLKNYKTIFLHELSSLYDDKEIESFFYLIVEKLHGLKRIDLALQPETVIDGVHLKQWKNIVSELKIYKPIQYILGETEFYGLPFLVNENVLIPRPETEELVDLILSNNRITDLPNPLKILDIGTGSGCIPIALKKNLPNAEVYAIDVSEKALVTATKNAELNKAEVHFILKNILQTNDLEQQFDIIVSNPPYVRNLEKAEINPNVLEYEPHLALFVDDNDALLFYRKITELAKKNLNPNGKLYFEINQYLGKETVALIDSFGFKNVRLIKDIYGNDRIISTSL
ncbi:peptide chain release factor N(5)-glutamine methyltransferase [Flavobacterium sp. IMCC34852]|uniref:Release factor glutamine methyltransferase n=1 Tax=Flavobacterium rivulicola TaxID=2732161 RepID=A0A7Y3R8U5_9FLAO|nr:peptide chain release factor N(5)-glutamine methyltransferase [Flavobacterium sp. IMCC34852]NNT72059.1 peptide chain release factor N(5)-glutamine methyltransferase [Flavobacterium sp. IMCC34852]